MIDSQYEWHMVIPAIHFDSGALFMLWNIAATL